MQPNHLEKPRHMRRPDTEITARTQLEYVLRKARVLFLCMNDAKAPYIVPVCFGWEKDTLYVHSALSGTKIDLLRADPAVGFSACTDMTLVPGATACNFSLRAESVAGTGRGRILADEKERAHGLDLIMQHYNDGKKTPVFAPGSLARTCVIAITILTLRGRQLGRPAR